MPSRMTIAPKIPQNSTRYWAACGTWNWAKTIANTSRLSSDNDHSIRYPAVYLAAASAPPSRQITAPKEMASTNQTSVQARLFRQVGVSAPAWKTRKSTTARAMTPPMNAIQCQGAG